MILTLASPRTVSTRIHSILCDYHNVENLKEVFNFYNQVNADGRYEQIHGDTNTVANFHMEDREARYSSVPKHWHKKTLIECLVQDTVGIKVFPGHVKHKPWLMDRLVKTANIESAVVILRKDINAQISSWYRARYTGRWGHANSYPTTIHIPWDQTEYDRLKITLIDHYQTLAEWYNQIPNCKWMWSEDAMTGDPQHQPHTLERELPLITENHLELFDLDPDRQLDFDSIKTQTSHLAHP